METKKKQKTNIQPIENIENLEKLGNVIKNINSKDLNIFAIPKRLKTHEFVILFPDKILELLDPRLRKTVLKPTEIRVLIQYAKKMQFGNQISISQADIAEELGLDTAVVSRCVKTLLKEGVFYKEGRSLYMSWEYIAKGNLNDFIIKQQKNKKKEKLESKINNDEIPF